MRSSRRTEEIRKQTGVTVHTVACDITHPKDAKSHWKAMPQIDILVTNAGGPTAGDSATGARRLDQGSRFEMIAPIELIRQASTV